MEIVWCENCKRYTWQSSSTAGWTCSECYTNNGVYINDYPTADSVIF